MRIALVLGGASSLWDDLHEARRLTRGRAVTIFAVNDAGIDYPDRLDHWCSLHFDRIYERVEGDRRTPWLEARKALGRNADMTTWGHRDHPKRGLVDRTCEYWQGSSGGLAVEAALVTKHTHIILCGMPMDNRAHYNRPGKWSSASKLYQPAWEAQKDRLAPRVRSCSGWSRDLLGAPDAEWLKVEPPELAPNPVTRQPNHVVVKPGRAA